MRDDDARVVDILETRDQLIEHVGEHEERFRSDPVLQAAAQRWLEILGEAASHLSDEFRASHPDVAWRDLIGMRTILAHGYFHVDLDVVWVAVRREVPHLRQALAPQAEG